MVYCLYYNISWCGQRRVRMKDLPSKECQEPCYQRKKRKNCVKGSIENYANAGVMQKLAQIQKEEREYLVGLPVRP